MSTTGLSVVPKASGLPVGSVAPAGPPGPPGTAELPAGGTAGQVLKKDADGHLYWATDLTGGGGGGGSSLPAGGTTGQVLKKNSGTDGDAGWTDPPVGVPAGGTTGQVLKKNSGTDGDVIWATDEVATGGGGGVTSVNSKTGPAVTLSAADVGAAPSSHVGSGGSAHANATTLGAGFMSGADKSKLDGIAAGATANATDAQLRDRSTHTGSQAISTVSGLQAALDAAMASPASSGGLSEAQVRALYGAWTPSMGPTYASAAGTTNDAPALQEKLNQIQPAGRGVLYLPPGRFRLDGPLTASNCHLRIQGSGREKTILEVPAANTTGAIAYTSTNTPDGASNWLFEVDNLTIVSTGAGGWRGNGISASFSESSYIPGKKNLSLSRIIVRGDQDSGNDGTVARFSNAIYVQNGSASDFTELDVFAQGSASAVGINLNYSTSQGFFGGVFSRCTINGFGTGIYGLGWVESLFLTDCLIAGPLYCVRLDASSVSTGSPHLTIKGCHINSKYRSLYTNKWRSIFLEGTDFYHGVGSGDIDGENIRLENGTNVTAVGCKFETGTPGLNRSGISCADMVGVSLSGNRFAYLRTAVDFQNPGCSQLAMTGNTIEGWPDMAGTGLNCAQGADHIAVAGNTFKTLANGIYGEPTNKAKAANVFVNCASNAPASWG